jgi:hypothetical protein
MHSLGRRFRHFGALAFEMVDRGRFIWVSHGHADRHQAILGDRQKIPEDLRVINGCGQDAGAYAPFVGKEADDLNDKPHIQHGVFNT